MWTDLIGGGVLLAGVGAAARLVLPILPGFIQALRAPPSNGSGHHDAQWRAEVRADVTATHVLMTEVVRNQGMMLEIVRRIEERTEGSQEAIRQVQEMYELKVIEPARAAQRKRK